MNTITFPHGGRGWLYFLFDNGLYANRINVGIYNAFIGRTSNFEGLSGPFLFGPSASWVQWRTPTDPNAAFVDLSGAHEVYFEGINMQVQGAHKQPVVHMHDNKGAGCTDIGFVRCAMGGSVRTFVVDSSTPNLSAGFDLRILDSSITCAVKGCVALSITNYGYTTVRGGYLASVAINAPPGQFTDGFIFDDLLSESLGGQPWLTLNAHVSNLTLTNIRMADTITRPTYLVKNLQTGAAMTIRNCGWNDGESLVDPASVRNGLSAVIEGMGARATYDLAKAAFQWGQFTSTQEPSIWYGNPTFLHNVGPAMQVRP